MTPQELKNSILQLAIEGRLVEQREEEGTAEELYAQIQAEKAKLIAEGKLKKQKALPEITEEEKPFELPKSWKWVRLGEVMIEISTGPFGSMLHKTDYVKHGIPVVNPANIKDGKIFASSKMMVASTTVERLQAYKLQAGMFVMGRRGEMGRCAAVGEEENGWLCGTGCFFLMPFHDIIDLSYLFRFFSTDYAKRYLAGESVGTTMNNLNHGILKKIPIPLPPLAEQHRIVAKIEELLPHIDRYEKAWSRLEDFNKRFPSDMQKSLLQYAIEGKLVEQRKEEGTAEELYAQIQAEKAKLIAEGKLKKQKGLPEITEEEKPFEIPQSWKWVRLGEIASVLGGKRIPAGRKLTSDNTGYKYIRVSDMKNATVRTEDILFVPKDIYPKISSYIIRKEDVYITVAGTIGRVGSIPDELDGANLTENADRLVFNILDKIWLIKCLSSNCIQNQITEVTTKVGQPKLAIKRIQNLLLPLPPLAEQHRIVARLEELLPLCDRLKK